jgi:hypothetical protein
MSWVATAVIGGAVIGAGASIYAAGESADAISGAAQTSSDTQRYIFDRNTALNDPFYQAGKAAVPGLTGWDAANPLPDYKSTVTDPMASWDYTQSPAYKAKYDLGMVELNKQLQARGLAPSGVGATRAADLQRNLTAADYGTERAYTQGNLTDIYKSRYSQNTDRYNRLLDQVKMGTGASAQMGAAGNQYANAVGQNAMAAGNAQAGFYAGIPGAVMNTASTGLRAYDYGNKAGWWNSNPSFPNQNTGALPTSTQLQPYDELYGGPPSV